MLNNNSKLVFLDSTTLFVLVFIIILGEISVAQALSNFGIPSHSTTHKTQDLSVLKGKETMFVNRGFMHPMYKDLQPAYHVFVDTKMLKGIWPATWIGDILQMSPNTKILLPLSWSNIKIFKPYEKSIYWLNWNLPFNNLGF